MGQKLYFDNYTAAGDILVLAICFVMGILVATSYNTRTRTFKLFLNMIEPEDYTVFAENERFFLQKVS